MLKAAVIGVGVMGRNHARVYRELEDADIVRLVGVADASMTTAAKVGRWLAVPAFDDYKKMLDECQPDIVTIAVPTSLHYEVGVECIRRGVHILMEKPIAGTVEEGEALIQLADQAGVVFAVGYIERFNSAVAELRNQLLDNMVGQIFNIHLQRFSPYPARIKDAGVVVDLASHDIDLLRYLMGDDEILRIHSETLRTMGTDHEDVFNGMVRFGSGAIGVINVNWVTPMKQRSMTITTARGLFKVDLLSQEVYLYENESSAGDWENFALLRGVTEGYVVGLPIRRKEPLQSELRDFINAVENNVAPTVTGADALETLRLALDFVRAGALTDQPLKRKTPAGGEGGTPKTDNETGTTPINRNTRRMEPAYKRAREARQRDQISAQP